MRNGQARGRDGIIPISLEKVISETCSRLSERLRNGSHQFTQYRQMLASKGAGKLPRIISIPTARDRIALKALAQLLVELFPGCEGTVPQRRVEEVRRSLADAEWDAFVRIDLQDFYSSIDHEVVRRRLAERVRKREITELLLSAVSTPTVADLHSKVSTRETRGVPQGLAISNVLAEIVVQSVDEKFRADARMSYFRFVDDILLLCKKADSNELFKEIVGRLEALGLTAHPIGQDSSKSQIGLVANGFDYLGYVFHEGKITVRSSSVRRLESALAHAYTRYARSVKSEAIGSSARQVALERCEWEVNLIISGCTYRGAPRGWIEYFRQMNDLTLLKRLDATVGKLASQFGLPIEFSPKSFMRAYWILRHPRGDSSRYIPNFDNYSLVEMRRFLSNVGGRVGVEEMPDEWVRETFYRAIDREVAALEVDIGTVS